MTPFKILIFRSAPSWMLESAIDTVLSGNEKADIDVYCPKSVSNFLKDDKRLRNVIDHNWHGFFESSNINSILVDKLSGEKYDQVIILYNDVFGEDYTAIRRLAFKIKPKVVSSYNINRTWTTINGVGTIRRYFLPRKWAYNVMMVVFTIEIIYVASISWLRYRFRQLFSIKIPLPEQHKNKR